MEGDREKMACPQESKEGREEKRHWLLQAEVKSDVKQVNRAYREEIISDDFNSNLKKLVVY